MAVFYSLHLWPVRDLLLTGLTLKARTGCYLLSWVEDACRFYLCGACELVFMIYCAYKDVITAHESDCDFVIQTRNKVNGESFDSAKYNPNKFINFIDIW